MKTLSILKTDFLERTRRSSFIITVCLVICLGYWVYSGDVFIQLETYRGVYNSAWIGSLMALVVTFFLGIFGFYLVKNTIQKDEQSGVGQIIATTAVTRGQYLLGKWLSNFAILTALVTILMMAAMLMQLIHHEDIQIQLWPLIAPFLFIAIPMMALVAALALWFETVSWLNGGFGNLVYFGLFFVLLFVGVQLADAPWLDVTGFNLIGTDMKAALKEVYPTYNNSFVFGMSGGEALKTFVWNGLDWSLQLITLRLAWIVVGLGLAFSGSLFFKRFDTFHKEKTGRKADPTEEIDMEENGLSRSSVHLAPLEQQNRFHFNFLRLIWLEFLLLVKGLPWYWLAGIGLIWLGCAFYPSANLRNYGYMLAVLWPVLVWSKMGEREIRHQTGSLVSQAPYGLIRLLLPAWMAGILATGLFSGGVIVGRILYAEPLSLCPWVLAVVFIPTLALALGTWGHSSKLFEVLYPILWYLGPFNPQNSLAMLDFLGIHSQAPVNISPLRFAGFIAGLLLLAVLGRRRQSID